MLLEAQLQEGMRDTSTTQITSGVCESGSLPTTLGFEGRFADMLKLLLSTATSSSALPGLSLSSNMSQGSRKSSTFFLTEIRTQTGC